MIRFSGSRFFGFLGNTSCCGPWLTFQRLWFKSYVKKIPNISGSYGGSWGITHINLWKFGHNFGTRNHRTAVPKLFLIAYHLWALFLIAYHLWAPYCHHVPTFFRKTQSTKYHSIKSLENQNWHKCDMKIMAVRNYNGHFRNLYGKYTKMQEFINRSHQWKRNVFFLCKRTDGSRVPPWRPSRTTSGTRTTGWEPLP